MDQQKRRRRLLVFALLMIGLFLLNLGFSVWWLVFDDEKINYAGIALTFSAMTIAVANLWLLKNGQKGPTPPDPK